MLLIQICSKTIALLYVFYCLFNSLFCIITSIIYGYRTDMLALWLLAFGISMFGAATRLSVRQSDMVLQVDIIPAFWLILSICLLSFFKVYEADQTTIIVFTVTIVNIIAYAAYLLIIVVKVKSEQKYNLVYNLG